MRPSTRFRLGAVGLALAALVLGTLPPAHADLLFLKDGFVLSGKLKRPTDLEVDPNTHEVFTVPAGHFMVIDGPRRIFFSPTQVRIVEERVEAPEALIVNKLNFMIANPKRPPMGEVLETSPWDDKWQRTMRFRTEGGTVKVPQQVAFLSPYWYRIDATKFYSWSEAHLTRELTAEQARELLGNHPDFSERGQKPEVVVDRRLKAYLFFAQAGWFDEAERELRSIEQDFPERKAQLVADHATLDGLRARDRLEQLKRLHHAGQFNTVRTGLANFPLAKASPQARAEVTTLQADYDDAAEKLKQITRFLDDLPGEVVGNDRPAFQAIASDLKEELHADRLPRLEPFLGQAQQWERQRAAKRTPDLKAEELLTLAATGWLLGGSSAESKPERALQLWRARRLVLEYQKARQMGARQQLLASYQSESKPLAIDEIMQLIPQCPPPEAEPLTGKPVYELQVGGPTQPNQRGGNSYLVGAPSEYRHGRPYPVLMVLHDAGENARHQFDRWSEMAAENGYLLVAPTWDGGGLPKGYGYSAQEHAVVLDTLRDLRRRFHVDSDRVFLFGLNQGGTMACDVGLGHPDLFAGVLPMGAGPDYFGERMWRNGQYLPFYLVSGDRTGDSVKQLPRVFDRWSTRGYPMVWIIYKGRGPDWFSAELPNLFDWMRAKRRAFPLHQLGNSGLGGAMGNEFTTLRHTDNRFYWLSTDQILPGCVSPPPPLWNSNASAATLCGRIDPATNNVVLEVRGIKQVTVWFGRNSRGDNMLDLSKKVTITLGLTGKALTRKVDPSLDVLLEDLYQRGDQHRLFMAKVDLNL